MEMKDVVLSALAEIQTLEQEIAVMTKAPATTSVPEVKEVETSSSDDSKTKETNNTDTGTPTQETSTLTHDEIQFLNKLRERLLVLFEGFQSPNNKNLEAKIDLTLNFLEYSLAVIDDRIETHKKHPKI